VTHEPALGPGLGRDQRHAEHAVGLGVKFRKRLDELDAAAFAPAAGVNLRLHHEDIAAESAGVIRRLLCARRHAAVGNRRAIRLQQRLGLMFVDIHGDDRRPSFFGRRRSRSG
jgi:hypothetical protein